uniref:Uncharacterized protein n=1 Tax=Meloidogyne enterolobii TaxID=390850 RepID=A0A6V7TVI8_MELEN|nr:unnamed protein product [Meloidogyne enterolobii]
MEQFKKISSSSTSTTSFRKTSSFKYSPLNLFFILSLILLIQSFNINNNQVNAFISSNNNNIPSSNSFFRLVRSNGDDSQQQKQPALLSRYGRAAVLSRYGKRSGGRAIVAPSSYDTQQTGPLFLCRPTVENLLFLRCHPYRT